MIPFWVYSLNEEEEVGHQESRIALEARHEPRVMGLAIRGIDSADARRFTSRGPSATILKLQDITTVQVDMVVWPQLAAAYLCNSPI